MRHKLTTLGRFSLGLVLSGFMVWLVLHGMDWDRVGESLQDVSTLVLHGAVIITLIGGYIRAIRRRFLFIGFPIPIRRLFIFQNEGMGLNNMMPVRAAGDPAQLAVLSVNEKVTPTIIAVIFLPREGLQVAQRLRGRLPWARLSHLPDAARTGGPA